MAGKQMRAAVVGASSILGKELVEELNGSPAAAWDVQLFETGDEGQAQLTAAGDEAVIVQPLTPQSLDHVDLVFFAGDAETAREFGGSAVKKGAAVVDLTGALDGQPGFLVRSPWIGGPRPDLMTTGVVGAHPAALMLALAAERLNSRFGLRALTATVLEPASQGGRAAVDELHQQTVSLLSFQSVPKDVFDAQVAFNLQSELGEASRVELEAISRRIRGDIRVLLGADVSAKVRFQVVQAPVFHGYTISALADLQTAAGDAELRAALNGGVVDADNEGTPSNLAATDTGDLIFGLHKDASDPSGTAQWLWMAVDNLRFASRNAVAAALELAALRPAARVQ